LFLEKCVHFQVPRSEFPENFLKIFFAEAQQAGLVSRVVDDGQGLAQAEAMRVAEAICGASRPVCALGKTFFYAQVERSVNTANRWVHFLELIIKFPVDHKS
jgi:hypothetical protein